MAHPLTEFLFARIADDEKWARARRDEDFRKHRVGRRPHLAPDDAERVLAQCAAWRNVVELHSADHECTVPGNGYAGVFAADGSMPTICPTMLALASVYAGHPDYREEWRQ
jgi:hypothetical protein